MLKNIFQQNMTWLKNIHQLHVEEFMSLPIFFNTSNLEQLAMAAIKLDFLVPGGPYNRFPRSQVLPTLA
jgi:hypothetical protein